jgi:site-specific DNA recombinase
MTVSSFYAVPREVITFAYHRLSNDNEGRMVSPETQWSGIVRTAQRFDVPVPPPERVFTDRNLSASDTKVVRLAYRRMLRAIQAIDPTRYEVVVLAYAQDRVFRQPADWQQFAELLGADDYDGRLLTDYDGSVDLSSNGGYQLIASYGEVKKTAKRTRDGIHTHAQMGKGHGPVPYGWTRNYDHSGTGRPSSTTVIVEEQAKVVRDAALRVLAGDHLGAICRDLDAAGVPAPGAGKVYRRDPETRDVTQWASDGWSVQALRKILIRKANIGIREHTSGHGARRSTIEVKADWPAILDDNVYRSVIRILGDPARRTTTSSTAKHLCSGIAICGNEDCGKPIASQETQSARRKGEPRIPYPAYRCIKGHVIKSRPQTDMIVVNEVLHLLAQPEVRASLVAPPDADTTDALAREVDLLARKDEAAHAYAGGQIDLATLASVTADLTALLEATRQRINRTQDVAVWSELVQCDPADIEAVWDALSIARQRSVIRALFDIKLKSNGRSKSFDPTTVIVSLRPMKG